MNLSQKRLQTIAVVASLVRRNIELNNGKYSGLLVPNIQSIIDLTMVPDEMIENVYDDAMEIAKKMEVTKKPNWSSFGEGS